MNRYLIRLTTGPTESVQGDGTRVADGVLYVMRAPYSGGVREMVKAYPLVNVISWEVER